ncbi:dTDP-4-dehydrorhamnose reductase [Candidatus Nitrosopumilus sediminis]|uniref:dTDP-4-dehydrorhamnose reductase n=1 Tax=Candidatus Nitrosopumilus sediminis TaxID=1229909 RepID=K0BEN6_9ARCH|nr:dTDP-4-dehydrorhamnose reductase [Candidatus Nitrosopumilus sediminis]AFS83507.1 dTDP-4-dehydrorhamnose reductase [Candidatus Nitrosopumilus sediminis]
MDTVLKMRFIVTGSAGLVGSQIVKDLSELNHEVFSCYHNSKPDNGTLVNLDLTNQNEIIDTITKINPDSIIHLAAMTGVDQCEEQPDLAMKINADATEILARQAAKQKAFFVYVSTDYVFDGKTGMKKESDTPNPLGYYGKSKLAGELTLNKLASPYAIARTSTPFGLHKTKKSFPIWVKESLESNKDIPVLVDQITSPTFVPNLSKMLIEIATKQIVGIFHTAGASSISRYNLAEMIAEKLNLDKKYLKPASMSEMSWKAQRPKDSSLDVSLASELLNEKPQTIQQSLDILFSNL